MRRLKIVFGAEVVLLLTINALFVIYFIAKGIEVDGDMTLLFQEKALGTLLPTIQLYLSSAACLLTYWRRSLRLGQNVFPIVGKKTLWIWSAAGFAYLGLDDWNKLHEKIDFKLHDWMEALTGLNWSKSNPYTDRLDDLIVGVMIAVAILILWRYRQEFLALPITAILFIFALLLTFPMVVIDLVTNRNDILPFLLGQKIASLIKDPLYVIEESLKIFATALFLLGSTAGFVFPGRKNSKSLS